MSQWETFLHNESKGFSETSDSRLCPIQHKTALLIAGRDSKKFLQGQVSCDIEQVGQQHWRRGAHCNHKGRAIFDFMAAQFDDENLLLFCQSSAGEAALNSLKKYIVFSKAEATLNPELCSFGLYGPEAQQLMLSHKLNNEFTAAQFEGGLLLRLGKDRCECWLPYEAAQKLWQQLKPQCQLADKDFWLQQDIQAGIGAVTANTVEMFIPQMLNFNELGGINYQKGCYTGQEIIARMQYRGNLKRHMHRLSNSQLSAETSIQAGDDLYVEGKNQSIGNIVSAHYNGESWHVLAVCSDDIIDSQAPLYLSENKDHGFHAESLPYAITNA